MPSELRKGQCNRRLERPQSLKETCTQQLYPQNTMLLCLSQDRGGVTGGMEVINISTSLLRVLGSAYSPMTIPRGVRKQCHNVFYPCFFLMFL